MVMPTSLAGLVSFAALAVACGPSEPANELRYAAAMLGCGPVDQPVTIIALAHEPIRSAQLPGDAVRITIQQPVSGLAGRTWQIGSQAGAFYLVGGDVQVSAIAGSVTVTQVDATNRVDGRVNLQFPSSLIAMEFSAPWIDSGLRCG